MIDWTVPQPSYEELHAKLDALLTERNAAQAEAKLWKQRYFDTLQELHDAQSAYASCDKAHEEWQTAYAELNAAYTRVCAELVRAPAVVD